MGITKKVTAPFPYIVPPTLEWDGNDGRWSTFIVQVGTPGQGFHVLPSTSASQIYVPPAGGCLSTEPSTCAKLRGVQDFNGMPSQGLDGAKSSTWTTTGTYSLEIDVNLAFNSSGIFGVDDVVLGEATTVEEVNATTVRVKRQTVAGVPSKDWFVGMMGLNTRPIQFSSNEPLAPSLLQNLKNQSLIPSLSYAYTAGASYREKILQKLVLVGRES
jgi:hypothetical protein